MTAVTADRHSRTRGEGIVEEHAIGTNGVVYVGSLCNFTTAGRIVSATAAASRRFAGECIEILNDSGSPLASATGNTAGTVRAKIRYGHEMLLNVLTAAQTFTNLGKSVYVGDNQSVTDATGAGTAGVRVVCGQLNAFNGTTKTSAWVALRRVGDATAA